MSGTCCSASGRVEPGVCPRNGRRGRAVRRATIEALLADPARSRLGEGQAFVCEDPACEVVYFGPAGIFEKKDLAVRVGFKETGPPRTVCYCFGHTVESIEEEIRRTGRSSVVERIKAEVKAGRCACAIKNPKGVCCLGDVTRAVVEAMEAMKERP